MHTLNRKVLNTEQGTGIQIVPSRSEEQYNYLDYGAKAAGLRFESGISKYALSSGMTHYTG